MSFATSRVYRLVFKEQMEDRNKEIVENDKEQEVCDENGRWKYNIASPMVTHWPNVLIPNILEQKQEEGSQSLKKKQIIQESIHLSMDGF